MRYRKYMWTVNWWKTIVFCFRMFPLRQAIHLPVLLFGDVDISRCKGGRCEFINDIPSNELFAQVLIGNVFCELHGHNVHPFHSYLGIQGVLRLGRRVFISGGVCIRIKDNATLTIGDWAYFGPNVKIACYDSITIDHHVRTSWESQIYDTNFHYVISSSGITHRTSKPIYIQHNVWIGNRTTIMAGAQMGAYSIVASNSLLNKDFSTIERGLFAGTPAKLVKTGYMRLTNFNVEEKINQWFDTHKDESEYMIPISDELFRNT